MLMSMVRITVFIFLITENVTASSWATSEQEALDERRDVELYQAVVQSVAEWKRHHNKSRYKRANEPSVCYGELGCFSASSPYLDVLPNSPTEVGTRFMLFSPSSKARASPSGPQPLEVPADDVDAAFRWAGKGRGLDPRRPTKVIVHGFGSNCAHIWVYEMRSALTAVEECNIICVDWENGATIPNYVRAAANTRLVGAQLARLLGGLQRHAGIAPETVHLIGFSLGAHVAGYAGAALSGNVSRITGLDPAGPLFESQDPRARLDQTDAVFVDVIHSNGENLILGGLGSWQPMGHVDFYPNGGRMQKGCSHLFVGAVSDIIWSSAIEGRSLCNHRRAYKFFTDSVSPRCHFPAFPCESYEDFISGKCFPCSSERKCGNMGYYADRSAGRGQLYLNTRDEEPFCAHQYQVKIESVKRDNALRSYGKILLTLVGESDINETFTMTQKDDQELVLGGSLSKILVPHPVLGEPIIIQLTYIAYSGWLSSGLTRWRINKVSLSDSFGKSSSICKNELDLETGVPVTLTLNSGDCNIPEDETNISTSTAPTNNSSEINSTIVDLGINNNSKNESKFQPTPVVHIGNEAVNKSLKKGLDRRESLTGNPWLPLRDYDENNSNSLDGSGDERESSRSLNSIGSGFKGREIVEPILKSDKPTNKIARSQNLHPTRKEISEPLLSSTTLRTTTTTKKYITKADIPTDDRILDISEKIDTFSDKNDWVPTNKLNYKDNVRPYITNQDDTIREINKKYSHDNEKNNTALTKSVPQQKSNRELRKIHESNFYNYENKDIEKTADNIPDNDTAEQNSFIAITVQLLPQRLASMLDQAERYARMTLLPLITAHTPKILSDFVNSFTEKTPKYLPLKYDHENETSTTPDERKENNRISNKKELIFDFYTFTNETENDDSSEKIERRAFQENIPVINNCENCTNINNIRLNEGEILLENSTAINTETEVNQDKLDTVEKTTTENIINKPNNTKNLYVDLPVFENKDEDLITDSTRSGAGIRYIPLKYDSLKDNNKNNKN